jgi:hypothetical protein
MISYQGEIIHKGNQKMLIFIFKIEYWNTTAFY